MKRVHGLVIVMYLIFLVTDNTDKNCSRFWSVLVGSTII